MTTLEKFNTTYELYKMSKNSMVLRNRETDAKVFIHRNAYNALLSGNVEDFRTVKRTFCTDGIHRQEQTWVEVLTWVSI